MDEWWQHILCRELGFEDPEPPWFDDPAIGRLTVTSPRDLKIFKTYNTDRVYADQVKPWGFLSIAQPTSHERGRRDGPNCLIGPFERDPERRRAMTWIERDHPERSPKHIRTAQLDTRDDSVVVLSYRDYYDKYIQHPEAKALDPRDRQPCHTWTRGLLTPRTISATELRRVGKESNRLADTEQPDRMDDNPVIEYPTPTRRCRGCATHVAGRKQWCTESCRKRYARQFGRPARSSEPFGATDDPDGRAARDSSP
jgi:hypothetical protein